VSDGTAAGTVTIDGTDLEYTFHAAPSPGAPVIVFLHEGLGCVSLWRDFPARLAAATRCSALVYSRHGYGRSAIVSQGFEPDYMHREALETLPALLDHFEIEDPVFHGHSDGASIALIYAGNTGRPVRGLIVEAPHVFVEAESIAGLETAKQAFETGALKEGLARHHADAERTFRAWHDAWRDPRFLAWNIEVSLPAIRAPVLMIQGAADAYGTLAQLDAIEAGTAGRCERLVRGRLRT
jgi:pimeloyl-ACP methyl ester carboxylesterase